MKMSQHSTVSVSPFPNHQHHESVKEDITMPPSNSIASVPSSSSSPAANCPPAPTPPDNNSPLSTPRLAFRPNLHINLNQLDDVNDLHGSDSDNYSKDQQLGPSKNEIKNYKSRKVTPAPPPAPRPSKQTKITSKKNVKQQKQKQKQQKTEQQKPNEKKQDLHQKTRNNVMFGNCGNSKSVEISKDSILLIAVVKRCPMSIPKFSRHKSEYMQNICNCNDDENDNDGEPQQRNHSPSISVSSSNSSVHQPPAPTLPPKDDNPIHHPLRFIHSISPSDNCSKPVCEALLRAPPLVFPPDIPIPPSFLTKQRRYYQPPQSQIQSQQYPHGHPLPHHKIGRMRRSEPPTPTGHKTLRSNFFNSTTSVNLPTSPISDSPPQSPKPLHTASSSLDLTSQQLANSLSRGVALRIDAARTLPTSSRAAYDALTDPPDFSSIVPPNKHSVIRFSRQQNKKQERNDSNLRSESELNGIYDDKSNSSNDSGDVNNNNCKQELLPKSSSRTRLQNQVSAALDSVKHVNNHCTNDNKINGSTDNGLQNISNIVMDYGGERGDQKPLCKPKNQIPLPSISPIVSISSSSSSSNRNPSNSNTTIDQQQINNKINGVPLTTEKVNSTNVNSGNDDISKMKSKLTLSVPPSFNQQVPILISSASKPTSKTNRNSDATKIKARGITKSNSFSKTASIYRKRAIFRHVLLNSNSHVFAITGSDSRQYVHCRPLSHYHTLIIMSTSLHSPVFISAIERTAAYYSVLIDEKLGIFKQSKTNSNSSPWVSNNSNSINTNSTSRVLRRRHKHKLDNQEQNINEPLRQKSDNDAFELGLMLDENAKVDFDKIWDCPKNIAKELCQNVLSVLGDSVSKSSNNSNCCIPVDKKDTGSGTSERIQSNRQEQQSDDEHNDNDVDNDEDFDIVSDAIEGVASNMNDTGRLLPGSSLQEPIAYVDGLDIDDNFINNNSIDGEDDGDTTSMMTNASSLTHTTSTTNTTTEKEYSLFSSRRNRDKERDKDKDHDRYVTERERGNLFNVLAPMEATASSSASTVSTGFTDVHQSSTSKVLTPWEVALEKEQEFQELQQQQRNELKEKEVQLQDNYIDSELSRPLSINRIMELSDMTLLLRHVPIKSLLSIIVGLFEERQVCIMGPNTSITTRIVASIANLLHPFEWPHVFSPILADDMLVVLGAAMPYFVGILEKDLARSITEFSLDLKEVVMVDVTKNGKVSFNDSDGINDLYKKIPRKLRHKLERRLTRAKTSCLRLHYRSKLSSAQQNSSYVYNNASTFVSNHSFYQDSNLDQNIINYFSNNGENSDKNSYSNSNHSSYWSLGGARLWKSRSSQQQLMQQHQQQQVDRDRKIVDSEIVNDSLTGDNGFDVNDKNSSADRANSLGGKIVNNDTSLNSGIEVVQNLWLDYTTILGIDKAMRKFYAELLEDVGPNLNSTVNNIKKRSSQDLLKLNVNTKNDIKNDSRTSREHTSVDDGLKNQHRQQNSVNNENNMGITSSSMSATSKKDLEKRQLTKAFMDTQMYMQWEDSKGCDFTFGLPLIDTRKKTSLKDTHWKKDDDANNNDNDNPDQQNENYEGNFSTIVEGGRKYYKKFRAAVMSDAEDNDGIFSGGEDGILSANEEFPVPRLRRRFRQRRRVNKTSTPNLPQPSSRNGSQDFSSKHHQQKGKSHLKEQIESLREKRKLGGVLSDVEGDSSMNHNRNRNDHEWTRKEDIEGMSDRINTRTSSSVDMNDSLENIRRSFNDINGMGGIKRSWYNTIRLQSTSWIPSRDLNFFSSSAKESNSQNDHENGSNSELVEVSSKEDKKDRLTEDDLMLNFPPDEETKDATFTATNKIDEMDDAPKSVDAGGRVGRTRAWGLRKKRTMRG